MNVFLVPGEVPKWFNGAVSKTAARKGLVGSNPTLSAQMLYYYGIFFALIALFSWGFGDFFIQRTTRVIGIWKALFFIAFTGGMVLFPFIRNDLLSLRPNDFLLLTFLVAVVMFG